MGLLEVVGLERVIRVESITLQAFLEPARDRLKGSPIAWRWITASGNLESFSRRNEKAAARSPGRPL
jgi:hypothetical protein